MRTSLSPVQCALPDRNVVTMFFVVTKHKFNDSIHVSGTTTNSRWCVNYDFFYWNEEDRDDVTHIALLFTF